MEEYTLKSYFKTASMIALGCRGIGILLGKEADVQRSLFNFGANLGIAFQIRDDLLDFTMSEEVLGKPSHQDLKDVRRIDSGIDNSAYDLCYKREEKEERRRRAGGADIGEDEEGGLTRERNRNNP